MLPDVEKKGLTTAEVCALVGVNPPRLTRWIQQGLIEGQKPLRRGGHPKGGGRRFTKAQIKRIRQLKAAGDVQHMPLTKRVSAK